VTSPLLDGVRQPKIYAFELDSLADEPWEGKRQGKGLLKVGYSERDVEARVNEAVNGLKMPKKAQRNYKIVLAEAAETNAGEVFSDRLVHSTLLEKDIHRREGEFFECTVEELEAVLEEIRTGEETSIDGPPKQRFPMRAEQKEAVKVTKAYFEKHADPEKAPHFLWNAKMRFGKTFTAYQLAKDMGWTKVLVLTYKPAAERAWRDDLEGHKDFEGWRFKTKDTGSDVDLSDPEPVVWFASFQDVLGKDQSGKPKEKNQDLYLVDWDCVIVDEFHFGAWRDAARSLYVKDSEFGDGDTNEKSALETPDLDEDFVQDLHENLKLDVSNFLYLSGTPFRALTQGEFLEDQVFNWTYSDEQRAKTSWAGEGDNPYAALPKMHLMVYEMPDELRAKALNNQFEFSLTEFFKAEKDADGKIKFVHERDVQKWLDLMRGQDLGEMWANISTKNPPPLPYEDTRLLRALQHTVWYLPGVNSCLAMRDLLEAPHNTFFHEYDVIVAAGSGAGQGDKALPPVEKAIGKVPQEHKSITLSCGKLMTGVTVPAWAGILMLRELQSPESYFQAAFRVQSPWATTRIDTEKGGQEQLVFKDNCYVFDFSPNRALRLVVDYATKLRNEIASDRDNEKAISEFMEFLPVLRFEGFQMQQLDASDVLDFVTSGISSSALARRWNSPELLSLDIAAMEALLDNPELLESLEQIEMFRNITDDLTKLISTNKELAKKKIAKEPLSSDEKKKDKEATKRRDDLKKRLQRFLTRIPAFMYLTDKREASVKDVITKLEPGLFQKVTGLTVKDFEQLLDAGVFNDSKMNDAVWKFRDFEQPSLEYLSEHREVEEVGGFTVTRNPQLARLIDEEVLSPGDVLIVADGSQPDVVATISDDYGIVIDGIRHSTPKDAARAVAGVKAGEGWDYWARRDGGGPTPSLEELSASLKAGTDA
jgi:hypothetical protein